MIELNNKKMRLKNITLNILILLNIALSFSSFSQDDINHELKKHNLKIRNIELKIIQNKTHDDSVFTTLNVKTNNLESRDSLLENELYREKSIVKSHSSMLDVIDSNIEDFKGTTKKFNLLLIALFTILFVVLIVLFIFFRKLNNLNIKNNELKIKVLDLNEKLDNLSALNSEELMTIIQNYYSELPSKEIPETTDHSMVIEFIKHVVTIENNLSRMDQNDRGLVRIKRSLDNIYNFFNTIDYEITPLLGQNIKEGHIIEIDRSEPDESVAIGQKIIYNVVKAEILFQGKQIQRAKVDIKYNPNF